MIVPEEGAKCEVNYIEEFVDDLVENKIQNKAVSE